MRDDCSRPGAAFEGENSARQNVSRHMAPRLTRRFGTRPVGFSAVCSCVARKGAKANHKNSQATATRENGLKIMEIVVGMKIIIDDATHL